jgi:hypothetical protein
MSYIIFIVSIIILFFILELMMRIIISYLIVGMILTGCIGITTIETDNKVVPFNPELKEGTINGYSKGYSREEVLALWGKPDKKVISNDALEVWVYNNRLAWGGVIIWLGIPIPLTLPIGYRSTIVYFDNNSTKKADYEYARTPTAMCSLIPMMWLVNGSTNSWCHKFKE